MRHFQDICFKIAASASLFAVFLLLCLPTYYEVVMIGMPAVILAHDGNLRMEAGHGMVNKKVGIRMCNSTT